MARLSLGESSMIFIQRKDARQLETVDEFTTRKGADHRTPTAVPRNKMAKRIEVDTPMDKVSHARSVRLTEYQMSITECAELITNLSGHLARMLSRPDRPSGDISCNSRLFVTEDNGSVRTVAFCIDRSMP